MLTQHALEHQRLHAMCVHPQTHMQLGCDVRTGKVLGATEQSRLDVRIHHVHTHGECVGLGEGSRYQYITLEYHNSILRQNTQLQSQYTTVLVYSLQFSPEQV